MTTKMSRIKFIDLSTYQSWLSLRDLPKDVTGVIIKAGGVLIKDGRTQYTDSQFVRFCDEAQQLGLPVGVYYFSCANSAADGRREAEHCYNIIKGRNFSLPVYYDCESKYSTSRSGLTAAINAFYDYMTGKGFRAGLYTNPNWYKRKINTSALRKDMSIWLAQWSDAISSPTISCDIWQYGHIYIKGRMVDADYILNERIIEMEEKVYHHLGEITDPEMRAAVAFFCNKGIISTDTDGSFNINQTKLECITLMYRIYNQQKITI